MYRVAKPFEKAKGHIWNVIASGLPIDSDVDVLRKFILLNLIILVGSFFLCLLSVIAMFEGDHFLVFIDLCLLLILGSLLLILRRRKNFRFISLFGSFVFGCFLLFLIGYDDVTHAKYLWVFTYPIITVYLLGKLRGAYFSLALLTLSIVVIHWANYGLVADRYTTTFQIRFISTYLTVFLFSFVAEVIHERVYESLVRSNNALDASYQKIKENSSRLAHTNERLTAEIDQRKRFEKALKDSENFLDDVIESIQDGICVLNPDLTIRHTNRVMKQWYHPNLPLVGKKCYACFHDVAAPCRQCPTLRCMESGKAEREVIPGMPGSPVEWLELFSFPIVDKDTGDVTGAVEFRRDITVPKRLERQLSHAQKMEAVGTLAGGVAHDLNNILSGIVSYPELLLMDLDEVSPLRGPIQTIQRSGQKAAAIVQDLLTLARRGVQISDVVNLNDIIRSFVQSPECDNIKKFHPNLTIETSLRTDLFLIAGSSVQLFKTIMNLVSNGAEAMGDGGLLEIQTTHQTLLNPENKYEKIPPGHYVVLSVADSGMGISAEDVQKIFEPFYTKKSMGRSGTGLGMTVVWGTVKDLNGYIDVQSVPDKGTCFRLYFPASSQQQSDPVREFSIDRYAGNEKILIVDDVPEQREIGSAMLRKLGYSVEAVSSGEQSIEYLKNNPVDLIVLDMVMDPGMDGLDTYTEISRQFPGQKAIIASGFSKSERVRGTLDRGAGAYVKKPYTLEKIGMTVRAELDKPVHHRAAS